MGTPVSLSTGDVGPADPLDYATQPPGNPADEAAIPSAPTGELEIPIDSVRPNPRQPRRTFDQTTLVELSESIRTNGVIQPIIVRQTSSGYELIAGERRWRAATMAGLVNIPAVIRSADELAQAQMALVENIQRQDLNPIERAQAYRILINELGLTMGELSARMGENSSSISNFLRLLNLHPDVQELIREQRLSPGHAKVIAGLGDQAEQLRLAQLVIGQGLSVRNLERVVAGPGPKSNAKAEPVAKSPHVKDLEANLGRQLGLRVSLKTATDAKRGRVVIHYSSLDEFDQLLERLGVELDE